MLTQTMKLAILLTLIASVACEFSAAQDWPALRSSNGYGAVNTDGGILSKTSAVRLKTNWKRKLGSGYSSVVVADGRLLTMYTDGVDDYVVCLDIKTGETIWQTKTNPMFKGENGSFDGPLSTPLVDKDKVYALSALGELYCLTLEKGDKLWSRNFPKETGVRKPLYGFVTSPIIVEDTLIVQVGAVGAENKSVFGMDPNTGETRWTAGDDPISSQTPSVIKLEGRTVVLAAGGKKLIGLDPTDGKILFEHVHQGGNGQAMMPVPIGNDQILLTLDDSFSQSVKLRPIDKESVAASQQWQENTIKNTYNIPVLVGDGVFAYSTRILTCVDPATGRAHWKTRKPGDGFLVAVDGHLIINTKKGSLHLAKAATSGYEEISNLNLFEDLVWSVPAYCDNSIYVRSLGEVARVDIVSSATGSAIADNRILLLGDNFAKFLGSINEAKTKDAKEQVVDQWLEAQKQFPVIEDDIAHFIYRGNQADVALAGDFFGARQEKRMTRVAGTDLFYHTMQLPADQRANYCFLINFEPATDRLNKRTMTSSMYAGEMEFAIRLTDKEPLKMSWFAMPKWKEPAYLSTPGKLAGKLVDRTIKGEEDSKNIDVQIYLPPGYDEKADTRYPVAYVMDGDGAQKLGEMVTAIDKMFELELAPSSLVVFLNGRGAGFTERLVDEIVPMIDKEFNTIPKRESRLVIGCGFSGGGALVTGAVKNEVFGNIAAQSPLAFAAEEKMIFESMSKTKLPTQIHLQWGSFDMFNPHENWDIRTGSKKIFEGLSKIENLSLTGGKVNDSTDWSSWKNRYHEMFGLLADGN